MTSKPLNVYLDEWKYRESAYDVKKRRLSILEPVRKILRKVRHMLQGPLQAFRRLIHDHPNTKVKESWPNVVLSIAALGYTLQRVSDEIYARINDQKDYAWGVDWVLRQRLERTQWCTAQINKFLSTSKLDFLLFVSSTVSPRTFERHDECTASVCRGRITNSESYKTKHVSSTCGCKVWSMPSSTIDIISKNETKGIPLACWSDSGLQVVEYEPDMPYVAISHV